ncbi:MAG TPA: hypothetical protein VMR77_03290 [Patescibacteria group bacterium]|jgi:hypothetical protein|nr:hypothetical protein [Patescibacteria group bacterium]
MKEKLNKRQAFSLRSKYIKFVIIPLFLLSIWIGLTSLYILRLDTAFSLLSYNLPETVFTHLPQGKLEKGGFVSGEFKARDNNLGILSLRFQTFFRPAYDDEDLLLFQIKQKDSKDWYYETIYRDGTIYDVPFFPFGFPIIADSKNKTYEFKLTSLRGNDNNSVALSTRWQSIAAKYKFTKSELLQNKLELFDFSIKKFANSLGTIDVLFSSFVYLLPLLFYLMLLSPPGRYIMRRYLEEPTKFIWEKLSKFGGLKPLGFLPSSHDPSQQTVSISFDMILLGAALADGLYLQLGNDFVYLLVPTLWVLIQGYFGFTSRKTFLVGIALLLFSPIFLQFNLGQIAEKMGVWAFLFLVAGTIQLVWEVKQEKVSTN